MFSQFQTLFKNEQTILISSINRLSIIKNIENDKLMNNKSDKKDDGENIPISNMLQSSFVSDDEKLPLVQAAHEHRKVVEHFSNEKLIGDISAANKFDRNEITYFHKMSTSQYAPYLVYSDVNVSFWGHLIISMLYASYHGVVMAVNGTSPFGTLCGMTMLVTYGMIFAWTRCKINLGWFCAYTIHLGVDGAVIRDMMVDVLYT